MGIPEILNRAGEGDLMPLPAGMRERYRLVVWGSFGTHRAVRAERRDNQTIEQIGFTPADGILGPLGHSITFREKSGGGLTIDRYEQRLVAHLLKEKIWTGERDLDNVQWTILTTLLEIAGFWELPAQTGKGANDGSVWMLEGATQSRQHRVWRCCPDLEDDGERFLLPCCYLCDVAGFHGSAVSKPEDH